MTGTEIEPRRTTTPVVKPPQIIEVNTSPATSAQQKRVLLAQGLALLSEMVRLALQLWPEKQHPIGSQSSPTPMKASVMPVANRTGRSRGQWRRRRLRQRGRRS